MTADNKTFKADITLVDGIMSLTMGESAARKLFTTSKAAPKKSTDSARAFSIPFKATETTFQPACVERLSSSKVRVTLLNSTFKSTKADTSASVIAEFLARVPEKALYTNAATDEKNAAYSQLEVAVIKALTRQRVLGTAHAGGTIAPTNPHKTTTKQRIDMIHGQIARFIREASDAETHIRALATGATISSYAYSEKEGDKDVYKWEGPELLVCPTGTKGRTKMEDREGMSITLSESSQRIITARLSVYELAVEDEKMQEAFDHPEE